MNINSDFELVSLITKFANSIIVNSRETLVEVIGVEEALDMILRNHDQIGLLKIDIEGLELEVIDAIPEFQKLKIAKIQYEIYPEGVITI